MPYILYKNPVEMKTLQVVRYLHHMGHQTTEPMHIFERNHPVDVKELPTILIWIQTSGTLVSTDVYNIMKIRPGQKSSCLM
jgi:hypothetical protein